LTPALGWNSWNCFGASVTAEHVKAAADGMVMTNSYGCLIDHGWTYVNIDDYWEVNVRRTNDPSLQGPSRDAGGRILTNPRFPDMKWLVDYIHDKGLKAGIYSSPGPTTCGGCIGSWQHEDKDAQRYAEWGFDYLKYDWCSYSKMANGTNSPGGGRNRNFDLATLMKPYQVMRAALDEVPRDIIFSLCQYGWGNVWEWGAEVGGNSWRTTATSRPTGAAFREMDSGSVATRNSSSPITSTILTC
jgi:alpha-galactosidase